MENVRDVTYELLRAAGLTTIFGNPGSNELPFLAGMPADFRYVLGLHEGAVLSMADGYAQARGTAALVNLHSAAGTGNALGALTNSVHSHSPLVVTAGQQARSTIGQDVMLANVDADVLPEPLVKFSAEPSCAEDVPRSISQAVQLAQLPPRGPVYVSVPHDDWSAPAPPGSRDLVRRSTTAAAALSDAQLADLAAALDAAEAPALVLGPQVDAAHANGAAVQLAEKLGAPTWIAPSPSRCPFPTRHPVFRGVLPASVRGVAEQLTGHDLVLVVGAPVFRYHQHEPGEYLPAGTRLIQLTDDPGEAARAPVGRAVVAEPADALAALADVVTAGVRPVPQPLPVPGPPRRSATATHPEELFDVLGELAPENVVYVKESTATTSAFWSRVELSGQGRYFFPAAGGLGFGLPAAVGAQLARPDRRVVGVIGDGAANYGITALWTAARYEIPVIVVVLNNGSYGALRWFADVLDAREAPGMDLGGIDFARIAGGYGVAAVSVRGVEEFAAAFRAALGERGPHVIEVATELTEP